MKSEKTVLYDPNQDLYILQLTAKKYKWWWLLLFLLLFFIPIPYSLKFNTLDSIKKDILPDTKIILDCNNKQQEKITNSEGIAKFYVKWDILIVYLFRSSNINFEINITADKECHQQYTDTLDFKNIKSADLIRLELVPKNINILVVNKISNSPIDGANVEITKYINSKTSTDSKKTNPFGLVSFYFENSDKIFIKATKKDYLSDSIEINSMDYLCKNDDSLILRLEKIYDPVPRPPCEGCGVFFTGRLVGEKVKNSRGLSIPYFVDEWSEYVGSGEYTNNTTAFPKAVASSFDGIAIDSGTRLIIFAEPNFKGDTLLDATGPLIINNVIFKSSYTYVNTITFPDAKVQATFPPELRTWSETDMQNWSSGSVKIICE